MRSVMSHNFSQVPQANIPRSSFRRNHGYKTTFDAGYLIPFYVDEALPGDTFNLRVTSFVRMLSPLQYPIMDNMFMDFFFFAVPNRLLWENWQKFNGEQINPGDSTDFTVPVVTTPAGGYAEGSLYDYFGVPTQIAGMTDINAWWSRGYNLIYNEWFRDENLQNSVTVDVDDGPDTDIDYALLKRGKRYDYFTSALPWPQKGDAVDLPLGIEAPVKGIFKRTDVYGSSQTGLYETGATAVQNPSPIAKIDGSSASTGQHFYVEEDTNNAGYPYIRADLTDATAATINELRNAFQIQKLYERDARGGTRYTEIIRSHFGVISPDARMQRPEYLGGGSVPLETHTIAQNSETGTTPQGNLTAIVTAMAKNVGFTKSFTEHCTLIGLVSVRADLNYQQGLNRMFTRQTRWDFYWPALAHLGEQAILNQEIYAQGTAGGSADTDVFGYQERWAEYRYKNSVVTGELRSNAATPLDAWHLAQDFGSLPTLNSTFIEETPPMSRIKADTTAPDFIFDSFIDLKCARPMPTYSVPGQIDRF